MLRTRFLAAPTFADYAAAAQKNQELWQSFYRLARVPEGVAARVAELPGRWHLLVLSEDWCGDAVNTVPLIAKLADGAPNVELRVLARDANPDLMDAHLTSGTRSIPVVIVLDEEFAEHGWWGPRPGPLQQWFLTEARELPKAERYPRIRQWYARDRGLTTLEEVVALLERAAAVTEAESVSLPSGGPPRTTRSPGGPDSPSSN
jgi:hypothetical protein